MKQKSIHPPPRAAQTAFTLIELLVVIGIIAILTDWAGYWSGGDCFGFNHGRFGGRDSSVQPLEHNLDNLAGLHRLYGDGRVVWKTAKTYNRDAILKRDPNEGVVRGFANDYSIY